MGHVNNFLKFCEQHERSGLSFMPGPRCQVCAPIFAEDTIGANGDINNRTIDVNSVSCNESFSSLASTYLLSNPASLQSYARLCFAKLSNKEVEHGATLLVEYYREYYREYYPRSSSKVSIDDQNTLVRPRPT